MFYISKLNEVEGIVGMEDFCSFETEVEAHEECDRLNEVEDGVFLVNEVI